MDWLSLMCACIALCVMESSVTSATSCIHQPSQIIANVVQNTNSSDGREKRETHEPLRTHFHYDNSINTMLDSTQRGRLQNVVIPGLDNFFKSALSVIRATSPILLERGCVDQQYLLPVANPRECVSQCLNPPMCGLTQIPEEHLKRCVECNDDDNSCDTRPGTVDGAGVPDTDLIIYVSAVCTDTEVEGGLLAFASCCELENELDRPIAGYINFCPSPFANLTDDGAIALGIHEVMHAIGFSSSLFQWFRDENGNPRTARGQDGSPPSVPSTNTVRTETYTDWSTRDGLVNHEVTLLVTPNVVEQARLHYNCSNIIGVELENQGGEGTAGSHWEQRIMGNEGMTGVTLFTCPFSRITLGLFQDTGWYIPNYEVADAFAWGLNSGCTIPHGSCREYITQQQESGRSISPYCVDVDDDTRGCTMDHEFISHCNLESDVDPPPTSLYQFFDTSASYGGRTETADYCPFEDAIPSTRCSEASNSPSVNNGGQLYGVGSRCFQLGRDWTRTNSIGTEGRYTTAAGCYRYNCTSSGVEIILEGVSFLCSCAGEEIIVDTTVNGIRYQGSYICPSCASVCYDDLESCPSAEPAACPGRITDCNSLPHTVPDPCSSSPCEVNAACVRDSVMTDSFTCTCIPPFEANGTNCEVPDPCSSSPCDTNAACVRDSVTTDSFTCACIPSFEADGISCEVPDPCSSSPCEVNAACVRDSLTTDSFTCTCIPPFEANGISCEVPDPCSSSPCDTNAACVRDSVTTDSFTCICIPPFEANGISCEVPDPCSSSPCEVNAACVSDSVMTDSFTCTCVPPFEANGFSCEVPDPCLSSPCDTNAACVRDSVTTDSFTCTCIPPFEADGISCEVPDPCSSSPCDTNAACVRDSVTTDSFTCVCIPPFEANGISCEVPDPCSSSPCEVNAACVRDSVMTDSFTCTCIPPFEANGISCEVPDPCSSSPCDTNAACVRDSVTTDSFTCACIPPFEANGISCEVPDPCSSIPCDANAACVRDSLTTDSFTCTCIPPFEANGISCEDPGSNLCHPSPCDVNAVCATVSALPSGFTCMCNPPYIGDGFSCQVIVSFEHSEYSTTEGIGDRDLALQICLVVEDSPLVFDVVLVTEESDDFDILSSMVNFQSMIGTQRRCTCVDVTQDLIDEDDEIFSIFALSIDPAIGFSSNRTTLTVIDDDDFSFRFRNNTPRVIGNRYEFEFSMGTSFLSATCQIERRSSDCTSGIYVGSLGSLRRKKFTFTVSSKGPADIIMDFSRTFRLDSISNCWLHLINNGITITGDSVFVEWQGTGPNNEQNKKFVCTLDNQIPISCTSSEGFSSFGLSPGMHSLVIRPFNSGCRRAIPRLIKFKITP
ncbi:uncharacterized protein LOC135344730 isoform X3 [Halichondria panicea]|uniref:uncharacterized protein LOC135344730 isoform X3 n=1 Tax=Halichondria panicea TaxID=6063 RepID=UPI00312BBBD2